PDWILRVEGVDQITSRGQYVLDLTQPEVCDHLYGQLHTILSDNPIRYIKWDMNRDIHHPASHGIPVGHRQTRAVYKLMDRLRKAHPTLEIESCASGGGRADYGVLQYTDRIWTSDSNDALNRQSIQKGASHFFPLEVTGTHIGPAVCHITGRRLTAELRVATAFFGHMGMELDLLAESLADLEVLKSGIALHKKFRSLLHSGDHHRLDTPNHVNAMGVVATDQSEALFSWCNLSDHRSTLPGRMFVSGLDPEQTYRSRIIWPSPVRSRSSPSVVDVLELAGEGTILGGDALMQAGLQMPLLYPETCLIFHFSAV
ncbi:MAG: alpha-galactosidase, partial [Pseudomonadota bacterium]